MKEPISILHLTDLHLGKAVDFSHERLLDALCADLRYLVENGYEFDLCAFTGDLVGSGDEGHFASALDVLLRILEAAGLSEKNLFLCAGNHDADRRVVAEHTAALRDFRKHALRREDFNALVESNSFKKYVGETFDCFNALDNEFSTSSRVYKDVFCAVHILRSASVICLNTATLTGTGLLSDLEDRGALAFPEVSLVHALKKCPSGIPIVIIGHHPLEFLNDSHSALLSRIIAESAAVYLCGHLHDPFPKGIRIPSGNLFISQGGALYEPSERWNGYAFIQAALSRRHFKETFRRWWEPRRDFSHAEDLANNGVFFSSAEAQQYWTDLPKSIDTAAMERWRSDILIPTILKECNECLTDSQLEDVFVKPEFERDIIFRRENEERIDSRVEQLTFEQVLNDTSNYVISSPKETGKTTLLRQMALCLARRTITRSRVNIPVLVNFGSFRKYKGYIETLIRQRLPNLPEGVTAQGLMEQGSITLLIDDVDFRATDRKEVMLGIFADFPQCRYILASSTAFVESAAFRPEISPHIPFTRIRMRGMRPVQLLRLIENHGTTDPFKADQLLERVQRDANVLNVPLTPVTSTFLIRILSAEPDNAPINQAALVERYIDMLLQKFAPRELLPATFNFRNKVDLLSVLAARMAREKVHEVEQNDFLAWILEYLKSFGLNYKASDLLRYLLDSKIIEADSEMIRFRLRAFFEFFLATRMREDEEFREFVFSEENYLSYPNEISFYSAISMRDKGRINDVLARLREITNRVPSEAATGGLLTRYLETLELPSAKADEEELIAIQKQVMSAEQAQEDRRALMEGEGTELIDINSQEIIRPTYASDEERWLGNLALLSNMLRHMELIPDGDKREILTLVLDGWLRLAATSLGMVGDLARDKRAIFNGITYVCLLAEDLPVGEVGRRLTLMLPIAVAKLAAMYLGTEKLQLQLEEGIGREDEPPSRQFMRFCILSDLMVDDLADNAVKVEGALRKHRYLANVFSRKLYEIAVRYRLPEDQLHKIRSLFGDVTASLSGVDQAKFHTKKTQAIKGLERQRLVAKIATAND